MSDNDCSNQNDLFDDFDLLPSTPTNQKRPRRVAPKLDVHCRNLLGEANFRYTRGDINTARKLCFEVIKRFPNSHEPYLILSQISENTDKTSYKDYLVRALNLYQYDPLVWCRLAELEIEAGASHKAMSMYSKAIKADPKNKSLHVKRLELALEIGKKIGNHKYHLPFKKHMAKCLPESNFKDIIKICEDVAKEYYKEKAYTKALEALWIPFKRIPMKVTRDLVNMMTELLLLTNQFTNCLGIFVQYRGVTVELTIDGPPHHIVLVSYKIPPNVQIDIKVKFIVCLVKLKMFHVALPLIDAMIVEQNVEEIGYLYLMDMVEDLMAADLLHAASKLLVKLIKRKTCSLDVWIKYAECLSKKCNMVEHAVASCYTVLVSTPEYDEVRYLLEMTLWELNRITEA